MSRDDPLLLIPRLPEQHPPPPRAPQNTHRLLLLLLQQRGAEVQPGAGLDRTAILSSTNALMGGRWRSITYWPMCTISGQCAISGRPKMCCFFLYH